MSRASRRRLLRVIVGIFVLVLIVGGLTILAGPLGTLSAASVSIMGTIAAPTPVELPTSSQFATATANLGNFSAITDTPADTAATADISRAKVYKTPNDSLEIRLPAGWSAETSEQPNSFQFVTARGTDSQVTLSLNIDVPESAYRGFQLSREPTDPRDALNLFKIELAQNPGLKMDDVRPVNLAKLAEAYGLAVHIEADSSQGSPAGEAEVWVGTLSDGRIVVATFQSSLSVWDQVRPTIYAMLATLVINVNKLPTATPTPTLIPLELTATSITSQLRALTSTATLTPTSLDIEPSATLSSVNPVPTDTATSCVNAKDPRVRVPANGNQQQFSAPEQVIDPTHAYCAILTTEHGRIVIQLFPQYAPINVNNFVFLAQQGFYDNIGFHRVIPGFVAQTGDPTGTGAGGPGYSNIPLEVDPALKYDRPGVVGMARTSDPNSAGSQFFITFVAAPFLDPGPQSAGYTIIGRVVAGMDVVNKIRIRNTDQDPNAEKIAPEKLLTVRIVDLGPNAQ